MIEELRTQMFRAAGRHALLRLSPAGWYQVAARAHYGGVYATQLEALDRDIERCLRAETLRGTCRD